MEVIPDARASAVAWFTGTLADLSVADLVQMLQLAGKDAAITVTRDGQASALWCCAGAIVDAESGRLGGEAALYRILGFEQGLICAELRSVARARSIFAGTQRLLMEAARRKDESVALRQSIGDEQRCYRLAEQVTPEQLAPNAFELCVLLSFSTACNLQEALESSELGDFETLTAMSSWIQAGVLVDAGVRADPGRARGPRQGVSRVYRLCAHLASARRWGSGPWVSVVLAALVLTPAGYFTGANVTRSFQPAAAPLPAHLEAATAPTPAEPTTYAVQLWVDPPEAEISLDYASRVVGYLETHLPRDGSVHEVRVSATGFLPATILFADAAPPARVSLEPAIALPTSDALTATASLPAVGRKLVRGRSALPREHGRASLRARARAAEGVGSGANVPAAQITGERTPSMRVID